MLMKFVVNRRYWTSDGSYEMTVVGRFERSGLVRCEIGFGLPANYKIRTDYSGREYITAKGRDYFAS